MRQEMMLLLKIKKEHGTGHSLRIILPPIGQRSNRQ
jgi:hypothetical protein